MGLTAPANLKKPVKPSQLLTIYLAVTFVVGVALAVCVAFLVKQNELGARGAAVMTLCWNVLFTMVLPLVLDWCERRYSKVRFLELEEIAQTNPELATAISEQCEKMAIPHLRLAVADTNNEETFSYGLWGYNPRLILPNTLLRSHEKSLIVPSIEAELTRFSNQDHTLVYLLFTVVQIILQQAIVYLS